MNEKRKPKTKASQSSTSMNATQAQAPSGSLTKKGTLLGAKGFVKTSALTKKATLIGATGFVENKVVAEESAAFETGVKHLAGDKFELMDSAEFAASKFETTWLVENLMVAGQLGVIGGPLKCLKTSLMLDTAISLGLGVPVLGKYPVPEKRRVAVFSGESGAATIKSTAERMCAVRKRRLKECDVFWNFKVPKLGDDHDISQIVKSLVNSGTEVMFLDPLYFCLTGGDKSISPTNLYEVGPVIKSFADACLAVGVTPFIIHHTTKSSSKVTSSKTKSPDDSRRATIGLSDLAFAGIGEICRQWLLLEPIEKYDPLTGSHAVFLVAGGSAGHSGEWKLKVEEGVLDSDFDGRKWDVTIDGEPTLRVQGKKSKFVPFYDDDDDVDA